MYKIGDKVVHQREGACTIKEIVDVKMDDVKNQYYILVPVLDNKANIYISTIKDRQKRIRPVIDKEELKVSEEIVANNDLEWIDDAKRRYTEYSKSISSFNFLEVMKIFQCLATKKQESSLCSTDESLMLAAQKLVCSEIALVLNQDYEMVETRVKKFVI